MRGALFDAGPTYTPPRISALAPWFGSKRTLAPEIVRELGPHTKYDEPFCGSLAVLLAKEPSTCETVNDLHGDLVNLARCLQVEDTSITLYGRLSRMLMCEDAFHAAEQRCKDRDHQPAGPTPDLDRAADFLVCSWFGRSGVAGTHSYNQGFCVRYTKNGGNPATRWASAVASIPAWHWRLRHVTILNRDGFELLTRLEDAKGCAIYVDPPYIVKGAKYIHAFKPADHEKLAGLLSRFKHTRVVVSYYEHLMLNALYAGWTKRRLKAVKALANQGARDKGGAATAPEVLLINGPSYVE